MFTRFSNLIHSLNQKNNICNQINNTVTKDPTTPQVCRYTTLWNVGVLKATTENKTRSVTTQFKKLTTGNNLFIVSIIVWGNCHILQFLHQILSVRFAAGRRTLKMCCYRSRLVFNCFFEDIDISQGSIATHSKCGGIFSESIIKYVFQILTVK